MNEAFDQRQIHEIKLKEYEENMNTYRYLAEMNVKYVMFFLAVASFSLKIYVDAASPIFSLLIFIVLVGLYVTYSICLVYGRMDGLGESINSLSTDLGMQRQDFAKFKIFLAMTIIMVLLSTILIASGMFDYHKQLPNTPIVKTQTK